MYYAIAPWAWNEEEQFWRGAFGAVKALEMRTLAQRSVKGGTAANGIFGYLTDPSGNPGVTVIADDPQGALRQADRRALAAFAGQADLSATRLDAALFEMFSVHGEVGAVNGPGILMPNHRTGSINLHFGEIHRAVPFELDDPEYGPKVLSVLKASYAGIRTGCLNLPAGHRHRTLYRKWLGVKCQRFRTQDYRQFQGALPDEEPIAPRTTIQDDFTRANGDAIGNQLTWTEVLGDFDTVSNQARSVFIGVESPHFARADDALSDDDMYAQVLLESNESNFRGGVCVRYSDSADTCYGAYYNTADNQTVIFERTAGSSAQVSFSSTGLSPDPPGTTIRLDIAGSDMTVNYNGSDVDTHSDATITGNLRAGILALFAETILDDFEASDGLGGGQTVPVGLVTETETAFAVSAAKAKAVGLAQEIETAFALVSGRIVTVGLASETETAFGVASSKQKAVGLVTELETALAATARRTHVAGLAQETETAFPVDRSRSLTVGLAIENETAPPVGISGGEAPEPTTGEGPKMLVDVGKLMNP